MNDKNTYIKIKKYKNKIVNKTDILKLNKFLKNNINNANIHVFYDSEYPNTTYHNIERFEEDIDFIDNKIIGICYECDDEVKGILIKITFCDRVNIDLSFTTNLKSNLYLFNEINNILNNINCYNKLTINKYIINIISFLISFDLYFCELKIINNFKIKDFFTQLFFSMNHKVTIDFYFCIISIIAIIFLYRQMKSAIKSSIVIINKNCDNGITINLNNNYYINYLNYRILLAKSLITVILIPILYDLTKYALSWQKQYFNWINKGCDIKLNSIDKLITSILSLYSIYLTVCCLKNNDTFMSIIFIIFTLIFILLPYEEGYKED